MKAGGSLGAVRLGRHNIYRRYGGAEWQKKEMQV